MPERLVKADLLWAATTPLILRYWSSSLVMRWRLLSTGQKPVEERQEDVLDNMVLVLVWGYWAILAGGEKALPASKWNPGVSTEQDVTSGSLQYYPASLQASV